MRRMRTLGVLVAVAAVVGSAGGAAHARMLGFEGTLTLDLVTLGPLSATGACGLDCAILNGSAGGDHLETLSIVKPGAITGAATVPLTGLFPILSVRGTVSLGTGAPLSGSGGGVLPVGGLVKVCLVFGGCGSFLPVPLTVNGTRGVGIGGLITVNGFAGSGLKVSLQGAPWTVQTAVIGSIPTPGGGVASVAAQGFRHGPTSETTSTAQVSGVVQLVTPIRIETSSQDLPVLAAFGVLRLHFVPEPGTFLLFGSGVIALGLGARRRARREA
jgi:hypothetical protein